MRLKEIIFIVTLLFFKQSVAAQEHPIISFFNAEVYNEQVLLNWNIVDGNNCNGINILRSSDNINYEVIGDIPGVCGAILEEEKYLFIDESPLKNQVNYYKLQLGGQGFTTPLSIDYYETKENGFVVFPNPSSDILYLYINGVYTESAIEIIDLNGKLVFDQNVESGTLFKLEPITLRTGTYILRLKDGSEIVGSSKIIRL